MAAGFKILTSGLRILHYDGITKSTRDYKPHPRSVQTWPGVEAEVVAYAGQLEGNPVLAGICALAPHGTSCSLESELLAEFKYQVLHVVSPLMAGHPKAATWGGSKETLSGPPGSGAVNGEGLGKWSVVHPDMHLTTDADQAVVIAAELKADKVITWNDDIVHHYNTVSSPHHKKARRVVHQLYLYLKVSGARHGFITNFRLVYLVHRPEDDVLEVRIELHASCCALSRIL